MPLRSLGSLHLLLGFRPPGLLFYNYLRFLKYRSLNRRTRIGCNRVWLRNIIVDNVFIGRLYLLGRDRGKGIAIEVPAAEKRLLEPAVNEPNPVSIHTKRVG